MPSSAPFISDGEYLFNRDLPNALPQGAHFLHGALNPFPINLDFRGEASHTLPMASHDNALSTLHGIEDTEEMRLASDA